MFIMFDFEKRSVDLKLQKKLKKELKDFTAGEDGSSGGGGEFQYKAGMGPRLSSKPSAPAPAKPTQSKKNHPSAQGGSSVGGSSSSSASTSAPLLKPCLYKKR